jgi:hypothetical protein
MCLDELKKAMENLSRDSRCRVRGLNRAPPEYEARGHKIKYDRSGGCCVTYASEKGLLKGKCGTASNEHPQVPANPHVSVTTICRWAQLNSVDTGKYIKLPLDVRAQNWASSGRMYYCYTRIPENNLAVL